jgi:glutamine synthetase
VKDPLTLEPFSRDPRYIALKAEKYLISSGIGDLSFWGPEAEFYIFNDVVPEKFMGRFTAFFRIFGTLAAIAFTSFLVGNNPRWRGMNRGPSDYGLTAETVAFASTDGVPLRVCDRGRGAGCHPARRPHVGRHQVPHPCRHGTLSGWLLCV